MLKGKVFVVTVCIVNTYYVVYHLVCVCVLVLPNGIRFIDWNRNVLENSDRVPASRTRRETNDCNSRDHLGRGLGCVVL